uniref:(northern house mosquito) hypothetical protein n=1 Tax=Culex pipiens TaxID=7175 RepID=A0A8D8KHD5_CULPI
MSLRNNPKKSMKLPLTTRTNQVVRRKLQQSSGPFPRQSTNKPQRRPTRIRTTNPMQLLSNPAPNDRAEEQMKLRMAQNRLSSWNKRLKRRQLSRVAKIQHTSR